MSRIRNYILFNFGHMFIQIFFVIFLLSIIVSFIETVSRTYVAQVDFTNLLLLLIYRVPDISIYLLPAVYVVAFIISIRQLSLDSEIIILFSIGMSPIKLARVILSNSILMSLVLFILAFGVIPITTQAYGLLVQEIKANTGIKNLNSAGFSQKFDNWHIFVDNDKDRNIVLFSNNFQGKSTFIIAKDANFKTINGVLKLQLKNGKIFTKDKNILDQINFTIMTINKKNPQIVFSYLELYSYWEQILASKKYDILIKNILIILFPILSIFVILYLGITEHRRPSRHIILLTLAHIVLYFSITFQASNAKSLSTIYILPILWVIISYYIFRLRVSKRF